MAYKDTTLIVGSGEVYFNPYNPDTLTGDGEIYLGNTPDLSESRSQVTQEVLDSQDDQIFELEGVVLRDTLGVNFTTDNAEIDNVGLWFGALAQRQSLLQTTSQSETILVKQGRHYQLGKSVLTPSGVRGLTNLVAYVDGAAVDNSDGLSMVVDLDAGRVQILPGAPWFFDGDLVVFTYDFVKQNQFNVKTSPREIMGSLRFRATNTIGPLQDRYYPLVKLSPGADTALKGDAWRTHSFTASARKLDPYTELVYVTEVDLNPVADPYSLEPEVQAWYDKQTVKDARDYVVYVNQLIRAGKERIGDEEGWYPALKGEFWLFGSRLAASGRNGFKGVRSDADLITVNSGIEYIERYGVSGDEALQGYVNTQLTVDQYPGFTLNNHSMWMYVTSNLLGAWQEIGAGGTAGRKSCMLRASSGFRGGIWSANSQIIFGSGVATGFSGFSRLDSTSGFGIREGVYSGWQIIAESLPLSPFTICSAEPGATNSPNTELMVAIGKGISQNQAQKFNDDMQLFVQNIGIYDGIQPPIEPAGPSCWGKETYTQLLPSTYRIFMQSPFPTSPSIDANNYSYFPITDSVGRATQRIESSRALAASPLTLANGSPVIQVHDPGHKAAVNDVVKIILGADVVGTVRGIAIPDVARWHRISNVIGVDDYEVTAVSNATSGGVAGGTSSAVHVTTQIIYSSTFVIPRGGAFWVFTWSNRGERSGDDPTGPITSPIIKPNDIFPTFNRETGSFVGVQCRPAYKTQKRAVGAMLVLTAFQCGYLDRADPDDQFGWGYLDYAEQYDLDPAKVLPWWYFAVNREVVFTEALSGFAACYDYVVLTAARLVDNTDFPRLGICMDMEHSDKRDPDLWERDFGRWCAITKAKGIFNMTLGHYMEGTAASTNGFTPGPDGNAPRIIQDPNCDFMNLVSSAAAANFGKDPVDHLEAQWDYMADSAGYVPVEKIVLSSSLGLGQSQIPLDDCTRIRAWSDSKGIFNGHVRRIGSSQGGNIDLFRNQQMIRYFPAIAPVVPIDPGRVVNDWIQALINEGVNVSFDWQSALEAFVTSLVTQGAWDKLGLVMIHGGENQGQSLKCLRRLLNGTAFGSPLPMFTVGEGYTFDGVQNYIKANIRPNDADSGMFGDDAMIAVYERTDVASTGIAAGAYNNLTDKGLFVNPRNFSSLYRGMANSAPATLAGAADSLGLTGFQRTTTSVYSFWRRGVQVGTVAPGTHGTALGDKEIYIGCTNGNGTPNNFRASQLFATLAGEALTSADWGVVESALTTLATSVGANV